MTLDPTSPDQQYLVPTRLTDMAQALSRGEPPLDRDKSIIAQNAGTTAANIMGTYQPGDDLDAYLATYDKVRTHVFNGTLALAGAEAVVESFEGESYSAPAPAPQASAPRSGGYGSLGTLVVKSGKHAGKTLDDINREDPSWLTWARDNLNNPFLKGKVAEYLAA